MGREIDQAGAAGQQGARRATPLFQRRGGPRPASPSDPAPRRGLLRLGGALAAQAMLGSLATGLGGCASQPRLPAGLPATPVPFSGAVSEGAEGLPPGWRPHITRPDRPMTRYGLVQVDGRTVLHAQGQASTSGVRCDLAADLATTPWLAWDWRADHFPPEATVGDDDVDDSPCKLVLGFDGDMASVPLKDRLFAEQVELFTGNVLPHATLCYVWDAQAPVGTVLRYPRTSRIRYLVVQSGAEGLGRFNAHRRRVADDYMLVFGEPLAGRLMSLGLLADSDDLKGPVEAWFGDVQLLA